MDKLTLQAEFDIKAFKDVVASSKDLADDEKFFASLSQFQKIKNEYKQMGEDLDGAEREIKQAINDRAKAVFGDNWQAIAGSGWKISRSYAGSLYSIEDLAKATDFVKMEYKPDSKAIDEFISKNSALPDGVSRNSNRTEVLRISVDDD